jgi:hypothetical protein
MAIIKRDSLFSFYVSKYVSSLFFVNMSDVRLVVKHGA